MGAPKQKWTSEEEEALRAGVAKHGTGKWKNIQKDPEFGHCLAARSNIDLKDKWRNMSVSASGQGSREKIKIAKVKPAPAIPSSNIDTPSSIPAAQDAAALIGVAQDTTAQDATAKNATAKDDTARDDTAKDATGKDATAKDPTADKPVDTSKSSPDGKAYPGWHLSVQVTSNRISGKQMKKPESKYNIYILKALSTMNDPNGSGITAINDFIEQNYEVPPNFRRMLSAKLRRLVAQEKIEKIQNSYKIKKDTLFGTRTPTLKQKEIRPMPPPQTATLNDGIEEAAITAAYRIADAENKSFLADTAVKEAERVAKMAEESDSLLQLAKEIYERCLSGEIVSMA